MSNKSTKKIKEKELKMNLDKKTVRIGGYRV